LDSSAFSRCFMVVRSWRCQTQRTPAGEIEPLRVCRRLHSLRRWSYDEADFQSILT
jgi:hypothetical protein